MKNVHIFEPGQEVLFGNINIKSTFKAQIRTFLNIGFSVRLDWKMATFAMLCHKRNTKKSKHFKGALENCTYI